RDGTHPLATRTREPRPLAQARRIRPAAPVGATNLGPAGRSYPKTARSASAESEVRPDPGHRPYARITPEPRRQGRSTIHILPAEYEFRSARSNTPVFCAHIRRFGQHGRWPVRSRVPRTYHCAKCAPPGRSRENSLSLAHAPAGVRRSLGVRGRLSRLVAGRRGGTVINPAGGARRSPRYDAQVSVPVSARWGARNQPQ